VKPTVPADFWPLPAPEEKKPAGEKQGGAAKKGTPKNKPL
jgi:hypothetical protein